MAAAALPDYMTDPNVVLKDGASRPSLHPQWC